MRRPATTDVTLTFGYHPGYPLNNGIHEGVDFSYIPDEHIYAPISGTVLVRPNNGNDGNGVYMQVGNQFHGFCHLQSFNVTDGQTVQEGDVLGIMGDTGYAQGRHLHWAVKVNGQFVDPLTLVDEGVNMPTIASDTDINRVYLACLGRAPSDQELADNRGTELSTLLGGVMDSAERLAYATKVTEALATPTQEATTLAANTLYKTP